jgi:hypothetical protein
VNDCTAAAEAATAAGGVDRLSRFHGRSFALLTAGRGECELLQAK